MITVRYFDDVQDFLDHDKELSENDIWAFSNVETFEKAKEIIAELVEKDGFFKSAYENYGSMKKYLKVLFEGDSENGTIWSDGPYAKIEFNTLYLDFTSL